MVTDFEELLGSGLHVLDGDSVVGERAGLLAVAGSSSWSGLGEEDEVPSPNRWPRRLERRRCSNFGQQLQCAKYGCRTNLGVEGTLAI